MTTYGLTPAGFVVKPLAVILADLVAALQAVGLVKANVPTSASGQTAGIMSDRFAELWQVAQALYSAFDPDAATGSAEDALCAITGTLREQERQSTVRAFLLGTSGATIPAGSAASNTGTGDRFDLDADQLLFTVDAWVTGTIYSVDDVVSNAGNLYACTTNGTSSGTTGPTGTGDNIDDGTAVWDYLSATGSITGAAAANFTAEDAGPIPADAGSLTTIETPVAGWTAVINIADAALGANTETDSALRIRRELELAPAGAGTPEAIRTALLKVGEGSNDPVTAATVLHNDTGASDGDGTTAHTVRAIVLGGADADVAAALFATVGAGIATQGAHSAIVTDSEGNTIQMNWERPVAVPIYVTVDVTYDASAYPSDGDDEVTAAIVANGATYPSGKDVTAWATGAPIDTVPGVLDVPTVHIGTAPAPAGSATISIDKFHIATFDTSRVVVVSTPGTP